MLVDRAGRKLSISIMFILAGFFLLPLVMHQSNSLTTGLLFGARMCAMGAFTVSLIYASEVSSIEMMYFLSPRMAILFILFSDYYSSISTSTHVSQHEQYHQLHRSKCKWLSIFLKVNHDQDLSLIIQKILIMEI